MKTLGISRWFRVRWRSRRNAKVRRQIRTHRIIIRSGLDQENNRLIGLLETADLMISPAEFGSIAPAKYCNAALKLLSQLCIANNNSVLLVEVSKHVAGERARAHVPLPRVLRTELERIGPKVAAFSAVRFGVAVVLGDDRNGVVATVANAGAEAQGS